MDCPPLREWIKQLEGSCTPCTLITLAAWYAGVYDEAGDKDKLSLFNLEDWQGLSAEEMAERLDRIREMEQDVGVRGRLEELTCDVQGLIGTVMREV